MKMKAKFFFIACFLFMPAVCLAQPPVATTYGETQINNFQSYGGNTVGGFAGISSENSYNAHGTSWATGVSDAEGNVSGDANTTSTFHDVQTESKVKSSVQAGSDGPSHVSIKGVTIQGTFSSTGTSQAFAGANQVGIAKYSARDRNSAKGEASTKGGSQSWAGNSPIINGTQTSYAGALTYGSTSASVDCSPKVAVRGTGEVSHAEYSQNNVATAWTTGSAKYNYSGRSHSAISGSGFAVTNGSSVVMTDNGNGDISAHSESFSFSQD